jgi:hypothetical protein
MKMNARRMMALMALTASVGYGGSKLLTEDDQAGAEAQVVDLMTQQREAAAARAKDPAWKPACSEVALIRVGTPGKKRALQNFCLSPDGNLLACVAPLPAAPGEPPAREPAPGIHVYSPEGKLLRTLPLEIKPEAIAVSGDGTLFVAGDGKVLKLDASGKVLASAASPVLSEPVVVGKDVEEMIKEMARTSRESESDLRRKIKENLEQRRSEVTGLAVTGEDVFMAVPAPNDFTFRVYRLDHALQNPKLVVEKLRGCCGQMDIQAHAGKLWIAHNARHQVETRDRDGQQLARFGKSGRVKAQDFGGCCEPKNLRILANGEILAAESGPPTCIKRFSAAGKFLGVVAVADAKGDCVRVTVERSPDGSRYYLMDTEQDAIRVFARKE